MQVPPEQDTPDRTESNEPVGLALGTIEKPAAARAALGTAITATAQIALATPRARLLHAGAVELGRMAPSYPHRRQVASLGSDGRRVSGPVNVQRMSGATADQLSSVQAEINSGLSRAVASLGAIAAAVREPSSAQIREIVEVANELRNASRHADAELIRLSAQGGADGRELRLLALMQLSQHQGLIANQFELIAEQLADVDPNTLDVPRTGEKLIQMAELAGRQLRHACNAFSAGDLVAAEETEHQDDQIDHLNHAVFRATLDLDGNAEHRELAYRHVLIARSLERIGDNAVDIAEQTAFLQTARPREFTDASTPSKRLIE